MRTRALRARPRRRYAPGVSAAYAVAGSAASSLRDQRRPRTLPACDAGGLACASMSRRHDVGHRLRPPGSYGPPHRRPCQRALRRRAYGSNAVAGAKPTDAGASTGAAGAGSASRPAAALSSDFSRGNAPPVPAGPSTRACAVDDSVASLVHLPRRGSRRRIPSSSSGRTNPERHLDALVARPDGLVDGTNARRRSRSRSGSVGPTSRRRPPSPTA